MQLELSDAELQLIQEAVEKYFYDFKESVDSGEIADAMTGSMEVDLEYAAELSHSYNQLLSLYGRVLEIAPEPYTRLKRGVVEQIAARAEEQDSHDICHTCNCPFCGIAN